SVEPAKPNEKHGAIRYALAGLKNVGVGAVTTIVAERDKSGPFKSLADFSSRFDPKQVNKRALEMLAMAGAFDVFEKNRALVHGNADVMIGNAQRLSSDKASGISDMFGSAESPRLDLKPVKAWTPMEKLQHEFAGIGFYLSGHPLDQYAPILPKLGVSRYADFEPKVGFGATAGRLAAIVVSARERRSQKGNKFAFAMFSDATGNFEAIVFSDTLAKSRDLLEPGTAVLVAVEAERDGETVKMRVNGIEGLDNAASNVNRGVKIVIDGRLASGKRTYDEIAKLLKPGGKGEVGITLLMPRVKGVTGPREISTTLPGRYEVGTSERGELTTVPGVLEVVEV
ncbi:MAG: DNA polymerase III subunit alpha, partial [Proteobacteria bacterium]|nr:DNA polymerase III subunit alpha [Pseudomonadota bacterium]